MEDRDDSNKVLIEWEITPQEEKIYNKGVIPLIVLVLVYGVIRVFFLSGKRHNIPFQFLLEFYLAGGFLKIMSVFLAIGFLGVFGLIILMLYAVWKISKKAKFSQKFTIRSSEIMITSPNTSVGKVYRWQDFKGFITSQWGLKQVPIFSQVEVDSAGLAFTLVNKKNIFYWFYPGSLVIRAESDNSDQVRTILKQCLPDFTQRFHKTWYILTIAAFILAISGVLVAVILFPIK